LIYLQRVDDTTINAFFGPIALGSFDDAIFGLVAFHPVVMLITFPIAECFETAQARGIKLICSARARIFTALAIHALVFAFGAMLGSNLVGQFTLNYS
jgi:hypothetical protein